MANELGNTVRLDDNKVMYLAAKSGPAGASKAFLELEKIVPLKGRRFYGLFDEKTNDYKVCTRLEPDDDLDELGLKIYTIPGGLYAYKKLRGKYQDLLKQIAPSFQQLASAFKSDPSRPSIEYYKRFDEFILYLPIAETEK